MFMCPLNIEFERPRRRRHCGPQFGLGPHFGFGPNFGFGLSPKDFLTILAIPQTECSSQNVHLKDTEATIKEDKDKFQINLDVQHFAPEEITVKTADGFVVIEAKHEEKMDEHGYVARSFVRRYQLPEGVDADFVTSKLSSDGVLSITAPLKSPVTAGERIVRVVQTGPVKKTESGAVEDEKKEDEKKEDEKKEDEKKE